MVMCNAVKQEIEARLFEIKEFKFIKIERAKRINKNCKQKLIKWIVKSK